MRKIALLLAVPCFFLASAALAVEAAPPAAAGAAPAAAEKAFTGEAAAVKAQVEDLFDASKKVNGAEKKVARGKIESALDWDGVAKACLGDAEWKKQSAKNRTEFRNLLKDVIVKTAFSRMDKFWNNTKYHFDKIDVKGSDAHVVAKFNVNGEPFNLDYFMFKKGGKWLIKDVAFEDLRYSTNINEQLTAFLKENNFAKLLQNLKKRRDDLEGGKKG